jgi:hypothetical protein
MSSGGITSLEVLDDERVVLGGNTSGEIKAWDIRMTSGSSLCFSAVPNQHPILSSVNISSELAKVDGLLSQAGYIPPCAVQCLKVDPEAQQRIAFHVASGWTGVYDYSRAELTHLHAPPTVLASSNAPIPSFSSQYGTTENGMPPPDDYSSVVTWWDDTEGGGAVSYEGGRWLRRRTGSWIPGSKFVVPSRTKDSVFVIDFRDVYHTGTRICKFSSSESPAKAFSEVSLSHEATCVLSTTHHSDSIIVLGSQGQCSLVAQTAADNNNEDKESG